ncbi:MAG: UDP-N-acetylmuramoyl-tripeptide--D-alanyl-D-alanine ligase [Bdellovibrionales bacterium]|nr:UDP-N-acetylmuramoyl-tripeptide--D-alanyl-D-alanine ligase [Bdellovibrionales bacterium]
MFSWVKLAHLANWADAKCVGEFSKDHTVRAISTDTRSIEAGDVFVALRGERFDGHDHTADAAAKGAVAVIAERQTPAAIPHFVVKDSLRAFATIGARLRDRFQGKVVAVTGSAGKSSTKEMVAVFLGERVVKSPASFNNLLGVSKTLTLLEDDTEFLVLEMGMNAIGEIREMCQYFRPQVGLITNIGDAHVGKLGSLRKVFEAKKEMFDFLASQETTLGVALNKGHARVMEAYALAFSGKSVPTVSYCVGSDEDRADVRVLDVRIDPQTAKLNLKIQVREESLEASLPIFGQHHAENIAAAISVTQLFGVPLERVRERLLGIRPATHRGEIVPLDSGTVLIDESYNSNPTALHSALESISRLDPARRKLVILGDMLELGEFESDYHRQVGEWLADLLAGHPLGFVAVGQRMALAADVLKKRRPKAEVTTASDVQSALARLSEAHRPGDVVLVKSSRGGNLDKLVDAMRRDAAR